MKTPLIATLAWLLQLGAAAGAVALPPAPAAPPRTIADLNSPTAIEAYGNVATWTEYAASARAWQIVVSRDGRISALASTRSAQPIEVDVGPDTQGTPTLAYVTCTGGCHLVVSAIDGSDPRTVPGSTGASHPTIWGAHVAWVRADKTQVVISRWDGSGRRLLGGAPTRKCYYASLNEDAPLVCARPKDPSVDALQLSGSRLALVDTFILNDDVGTVGTTTEVRTEGIGGGPQRLVALLGVGEGDESWLGPSWSGGKLYFYEDSIGAGFVIYEFDPASGTYAKAPAYAYLTGFSVVAGRAYEVTSPGNPLSGHICGEEAISCLVRLTGPLVLKRAKAPVHVPSP